MGQQLERKIIWQKWVNPLTGAGGDEEPERDEDEGEGYQDSVEKDLKLIRNLQRPNMYKPKLGHVLAGPMGLIPVNEHGDAAVVYDFWIAHTNFDIDGEVEAIGSTVPGVEAWDTFSRYRARIAFGKAFKSAEVKAAIQKALGCNITPKTTPVVTTEDRRRRTLERLKKMLSSSSPAWAIFELPDGQLQSVRGSEHEVREQVERRKTLANPSKIITSWDGP